MFKIQSTLGDRLVIPVLVLLIGIFGILWARFPEQELLFLLLILGLVTLIIGYFVIIERELRVLARKIADDLVVRLQNSGFLLGGDKGSGFNLYTTEKDVAVFRKALENANLRILRGTYGYFTRIEIVGEEGDDETTTE